MQPTSHIRTLRSGGILLSSLYVFLLGAASFCMFAHASPTHGKEQHAHHQANHSTLCMWACQIAADTSASQVTVQPTIKPILLVSSSVVTSSTITREYVLSTTRSRAPPQVPHTIS